MLIARARQPRRSIKFNMINSLSEKVFDTSQLFIEIYFGGHCTLISLNDINHINLIYILKDR